ncbi:hypothetical protein, partial [Mesorhizobium sp. dw_380]|uniref:hypothetical protein n=1 Tax=Mesorhizobium sp. dw_380 TaxID=2812001 RepID=UPI001BDDCDC3
CHPCIRSILLPIYRLDTGRQVRGGAEDDNCRPRPSRRVPLALYKSGGRKYERPRLFGWRDAGPGSCSMMSAEP